MTASTTAAIALTASGLTVLGVSTGIDPGLLFAGLAGGWWALSYSPEPMPLLRRLTIYAVSALAGAWGAVLAGAWLASIFTVWWPAEAGGASPRHLIAMLIGLLAHRQFGPLLMRRAAHLDRPDGQP